MELSAADLRGTVLVRDCLEVDAGFLLVQLIKAAVSGGGDPNPPAARRRVVLLAAQHAASHYALVLRKVGLAAPALAASGKLTVIDFLPSLGAGLPPLQHVYQQLAAAVAEGGGSGGCNGGTEAGSVCLVIDDLAVLHCLADSPSEWRAFLYACISVGQEPGSCFVGLVHSNLGGEDEWWVPRLEHAASLVLDVEPLDSGRSAVATGRVVLTRRDTPPEPEEGWAAATAATAAATVPGSSSAPGSLSCAYKLAETGATYIYQVVL